VAVSKIPASDLVYDLTELKKVDPALVRYEETETIGLSDAQAKGGISIGPDDKLWAAGGKNLTCLGEFGHKAPDYRKMANDAQCVAAGKDGKAYVGVGNHVEVYAQGKDPVVWPAADAKSFITSIAVGEKDVFVADANAQVVLRYDTAGKLIGRIGEENAAKNIPGIVVPSPYFDVALAPGGGLWVVNPGRRRVESYTYDGDLVWWWGRSSPKIDGFCGCCNPTHLAILPDGSFVTSEKGLPRIKVYKKTGDLDCVVAPPSAFKVDEAGMDIAVDSKGRVYVLDPGEGKIRVFERKKAETKAKS
jgi:hypothetical protein